MNKLVLESKPLTLHIENATHNQSDAVQNGVALGLAIVRKILDIHHSRLVTTLPTAQTRQFSFSLTE